ncbi:MAG TPA: glycosyltransferase family 2 protein [Gemmataceae bacterium]|jgi:cellulose synthase/poly-beta-1,6-N-acetylglucosamine synthase-like glycosyltransferase|nr:glycosyltransferase family 2 protein [Gemmataceae bacterium]
MLIWLTVLVSLALLVGLLISSMPFAAFMWHLWRRSPMHPDEVLPNAAVILCLRGADSTLERCIEGVLTQDYPQYEVIIIVDHVDDPAREVAQRVVHRLSNSKAHLETLTKPRESCSLKCSSLLQAISGLNNAIEILAFLDADTTPYPGWLRELVSPLSQPGIGATTGARWFMPQTPTWGSLVRYQWGIAAVLTCNALGIAWGGTLAIRRDAFLRAGLQEKWASAFCEDTMIPEALRPLGLRLKYLPRMVMVNRESCRLREYLHWCARQMLTTRLYHRSAWRAVVAHAWITALCWIAPIFLAIWATLVQEWNALLWLSGGLGIFWAVQWLAMLLIERSAQRIVAARGEPSNWLTWRALWRTFVCIPITQMMYWRALVAAFWTRRVCWRGVWYDIAGPWQVRMNSYQPYSVAASPASHAADSKHQPA